MDDAQVSSALAEILLLLRPLVDRAVSSVEEEAPVDELLSAFQESIQALARKEPDVWRLQIVQHIYDSLRASVAAPSDENLAPEENIAAHQAEAFAENKDREREALEQAALKVYKAIHTAASQLCGAVNQALSSPTESEDDGDREQFMARVWEEISSISAMPKEDEQSVDGGDEDEKEAAAAEGASNVEILTFDDDSQEGESADSSPTADGIPSLIERMQATDAMDRAEALDELAQVPVFEVLHCTTRYAEVVRAVVGLFLEADTDGVAVRESAKRVLYRLLSDCEDPHQVLDAYWAVVEFVGAKLGAGELFLSKFTALEAADPTSVRVVDTFRVLLLLLERIPLHWIHFSPETLAKVFASTFQVLTMYSKHDAEVEVAYARPLDVLACLEEYPRWLKIWMLKAPSRDQLFLSLNEVGLVGDALQQLSHFRLVAEPSGRSVAALEKRSTTYLLGLVALVSEYDAGREIVRGWRCLLMHKQLRSRVTAFESCRLRDLAPVSSTNGRLFRLDESDCCEIEAEVDAEKSNSNSDQQTAVAAVIWSVLSAILADSESVANDSRSCNANHNNWEAFSLLSVSRIIAREATEELLESVLKVLQACVGPASDSNTCQPRRTREYASWRPFRDPTSASTANQLVCEHIYALSANNPQATAALRSRGWMVLEALLSRPALIERLASSSSDVVALMFQLWQDCLATSLQDMARCPSTQVEERIAATLQCAPQLIVLASTSDLIGLVNSMVRFSGDFSERCDGGNESTHYTAALIALGSSASGFRALRSVGLINERSKSLTDFIVHQAPAFHDIASFITWSSELVRDLLDSELISGGLYREMLELSDSGDFSIAVNSSCDECPPASRNTIRSFSLICCLLASPFAPDALIANDLGDQNAVAKFIRETLQRHGTSCGANSDTEDTCCVALRFAISLVGAIPSKLKCSGFLTELLGLLDRGDSNASAPYEPAIGVGPCSYLALKLRYELENVGGPSERVRWPDLHDVDDESLAKAAEAATITQRNTGQAQGHLIASSNEMKRNLTSEIQLSAPLDSLPDLIWGRIVELEQHTDTRVATSGLGRLLLSIVKSKLSPLVTNGLGPLESPNYRPQTPGFPPAIQRRLLNRMYKSYCQTLSLPSFPTILHGIIKRFGSAAMDCFPVTVLMLIGDACEEDDDVLAVLSQCHSSPLVRYLWPSTAAEVADGTATPPSVALTEAVEWILAREFPQVIHSIRLCNCSVGALVTRWHSQSFWNYLDWDGIASNVCLSLLYGADFLVYVLVAALVHFEPEVRYIGARHSSEGFDAFLELLELPITSFRFSDWKDELLRLRVAYHDQAMKMLASH